MVEQLANDLKAEFPEMTGLSRTNLLYMRAFAEGYPDESIIQQAVGQIPWGHNVRILDALKDPYNFDFLTLTEDAQERELERALMDHIRDFLMELGLGFAFLGSQYLLVVSNKEYRLDLLFYHVHLHLIKLWLNSKI